MAEEIIDRIEYLQREYGANCFQFLDEDFFISKKRLLQFLDLIEEKGLKFLWRPWTRSDRFNDNYIDHKLAKRLERNGMVVAVMGGECGSQRILDSLNKKITVQDTINAVNILKNTNIIPRVSFMVGLPQETRADILNTYRLALYLRKIDKRVDLQIYSFRMYPGSPIYNEAKERFNLREPSSLEEWAQEDYIKNYGYLSYDKYVWIKDRDEFERMRYFCDRFILGTTDDIRLSRRIIYAPFRLMAILRFEIGWFSFCFDIFTFKLLVTLLKKLKR
jgi:radical SAM superfamily enzyme YgiQ (UPF0313 family)